MRVTIIFLMLLALAVLISALISKIPSYADRSGLYRSISPKDAKKRLDSGENIILVDVRNPGEYEQKHIPKSILLPLGALEREAPGKLKDKEATIFVYCLSGGRSAKASAKLADMGYENVYNMGGISSWPYETEEGR